MVDWANPSSSDNDVSVGAIMSLYPRQMLHLLWLRGPFILQGNGQGMHQSFVEALHRYQMIYIN